MSRVALSFEWAERVRAAAAARGVMPSMIMHEALQDYFAAREQAGEPTTPLLEKKPGCKAHNVADLTRAMLSQMAVILQALRRLSELGLVTRETGGLWVATDDTASAPKQPGICRRLLEYMRRPEGLDTTTAPRAQQ